MDLTEIRTEMARIVAEHIERPEGVHREAVRAEFDQAHPDVSASYGRDLYWKALGGLADDAIKPLRSKSLQLSLPGIDVVPATVTVPDGEGGFALKVIRWATIPDLEADRQIHAQNVAAAVAAEDVAEKRNRVLIPIMEAHQFATAGEAIEFLAAA